MTIEDSVLSAGGARNARARVKICGITSLEDGLGAVAAGADALGFVFYPESPRYVRPEVATEICRALPPFVSRVGLFVNESQPTIAATSVLVGLDTLQLHGDETPQFCSLWRGGLKVIKAFRIGDRHSLLALAAFTEHADAFLLDAFVPGVPGGTGKTFNWDLAREAAIYRRPIILAGGLTPANVQEAVTAADPFAVDVSSGVERAPGRKDLTKVAEFIRAASGG